jgi:RNA polymerase sigma factor (sigma-70 family)
MEKKEDYTGIAIEFQNTKTHSSFTRLYHAIRPGLKYYIQNFTKDGDITEDLLARTFEKIYRKIDSYKPEYSITTWAYAIARRECLRWIKRERNKNVSLSYFNEHGGEAVDNGGHFIMSLGNMVANPEDYVTETEAWKEEGESTTQYDLTVKSINALKPMYREILVDNLFNGLKYKEIAYKLEPGLEELTIKFEAGELNKAEEKQYNILYKTILQRVKNRVRRGKMIVENDVKAQMADMDI